MTATKRPRFGDLEMLARERAYTVRRRGRRISWRRNAGGDEFVSFGVSSAIQDILLDCSSEKHPSRGTPTTKENPA